jgi:L-rhamnose isomerase/sugar isomerase
VTMAQELYAKAALVDYHRLSAAQSAADLVRAETCLQDAFATDVRPAIREWRTSNGLAVEPMDAFHESGYLDRITRQRAGRKTSNTSAYA